MTTGSLEASDAASAAVQKTPHRVSLESMKTKIEACEYHNPGLHPSMTVCFMKMKNGFVVVGKSAPADPANFDEKLGMEFAHEDCLRQLWPLEGYALREQMAGMEG